MSAQATDGIQNIDRKSISTSKTFGRFSSYILVNHSKTKGIDDIGHVSPSFAQAENDDSDEDKDYDGGKIETGASGGESALRTLLRRVAKFA